jgi:hypothetical protein
MKGGTDKRVKALNEAIIRLSKENEQLKSESHEQSFMFACEYSFAISSNKSISKTKMNDM